MLTAPGPYVDMYRSYVVDLGLNSIYIKVILTVTVELLTDSTYVSTCRRAGSAHYRTLSFAQLYALLVRKFHLSH